MPSLGTQQIRASVLMAQNICSNGAGWRVMRLSGREACCYDVINGIFMKNRNEYDIIFILL